MTAIQEEIKKLLAEEYTLKKANARLSEIIQDLNKAKLDIGPLEKQLQKEFEDVEKLEQMGIKALFHKVLGNKESQLEKERQEYLQVSLKYDQCRKTIDLLEFEKNILEKKSGSLSAIEKRLNELSLSQEKELMAMSGEGAMQIRKINSQIEAQRRLVIDVNEAMKAGTKSLECIDAVIAGLQQAHNWGQWDVSGRNPMSNHLKYTAIDKAKDWAYEANRQLNIFEKELIDVYKQIPPELHIQIDSFNRFVDIFFDNLITDWIIQQKIHNALNNTLNIRDKVVLMVKTLETEFPKINQNIIDLERDKKEYILKN